jgi:hypothetical protein
MAALREVAVAGAGSGDDNPGDPVATTNLTTTSADNPPFGPTSQASPCQVSHDMPQPARFLLAKAVLAAHPGRWGTGWAGAWFARALLRMCPAR